MQNAGELKLLGVFLKTHGIDGHLIIKLHFSLEDELEEGEPVFVEIDGIPVPFFILHFSLLSDNSAFILLDEIDNSGKASEFINCRVFIEKEKKLLTNENHEGDNRSYENLTGFRVVDEKLGETGILQEIVEYPENPVMRIDSDGRDILVPFHNTIVRNIDLNNRIIEICAPDGLLNLYL